MRTVNVRSGHSVVMRLHRKLPPPDFHMAPDPKHAPVALQVGANPGIDREFFRAWAEQNEALVAQLGITSEDEEPAADAAQQEEDENGPRHQAHELPPASQHD